MRPRLTAAVTTVLVAGLTVGCTGAAPEEAAPSPSPVAAPPAAPSPTAAPPAVAGDLPALADAPGGQSSLWLDTIGVPVVAAIRTSTPLARLATVPAAERAAVCRQVATDLDGIAPPQVLSSLAITADPETATLLVGDLQAKGDLLAACARDGAGLEELIAEVEGTHAVAVAWLDVLGGGA